MTLYHTGVPLVLILTGVRFPLDVDGVEVDVTFAFGILKRFLYLVVGVLGCKSISQVLGVALQDGIPRHVFQCLDRGVIHCQPRGRS